MSLTAIDNPLERLLSLPNAINWRGEWEIGGQYYLNDIVVDPNGSTYILTGATANASGLDPSHNVLWTEFSGVSTGVASLQAGEGISIDDADPANPQVNNEGVLTLIEGTNVSIVEDPPQKFTINATGITEVIGGAGIEVVPDLDNPLARLIFNTGVLSISVDEDGLSKTSSAAGQLVTINNTGVLTLIPGSGIASTGGQIPNLSNTGVLFVTGQGALNVSGLAQSPTITCVTGGLSLIFTPTSSNLAAIGSIVHPDTAFEPPVVYWGILNVLLVPSFFSFSLNQPEPVAGGYLLDFSNWVFAVSEAYYIPPPVGSNGLIYFDFLDDTTPGTPFYRVSPLISYSADQLTSTSGFALLPNHISVGKLFFDFNDAWQSGIATITRIQIWNATLGDVVIASAGPVRGTYFPNGIQ